MQTGAFISVFIAIGIYIVYVAVPSLSESQILSLEASRSWINSGRFMNYNQHAVFYKDSLGDLLTANSARSDSYVMDAVNEISHKPILLLLHGFPTFSYDFSSIYGAFERDQKFHVIAFDYLGFGVSDKPYDIDYGYTLQAHVADHVLRRLIVERNLYCRDIVGSVPANVSVHILAHDLGDSVAQELLAMQLDRRLNQSSQSSLFPYTIKSVILLNGGLFPETHHPTITQRLLLSKVSGPIFQLFNSFTVFSKSLSVVFGSATQPTEEHLSIFWAATLYKGGNLLMHKLQQYVVERRDNRERIVNALVKSAAEMPIMLLNGPADPVSGVHMTHRYRELIAPENCNIILLGADIGHYPHLEDPADVLHHCREFWAHSVDRTCTIQNE